MIARHGDTAPNFDGVARLYRWMEYLSLGPALARMRRWHLDAGRLDGCRRALVLGDGDGRFTARLLARNRQVQVIAVDSSATMLGLLADRSRLFAGRLRIVRADAREFLPQPPIDLVVTHFFLDCLTEGEVHDLVRRVAIALEPESLWVVSDFRVDGWRSGLLVSGLYLAFRLLTGLRITRLPDHRRPLREQGFRMLEEKRGLCGLLFTEVWMLDAGPASQP